MSLIVVIIIVLIVLRVLSPNFSFSEMLLRIFEKCLSLIAVILVIYMMIKYFI